MRNGYITHMEYAATGEGYTHEIYFCYADNKKEAIEKHLDMFVGKDIKWEQTRNYFRHGIDVVKIKSKKAKEILKEYFVHGEALYQHMAKSGIEMHFKVYYNHS